MSKNKLFLILRKYVTTSFRLNSEKFYENFLKAIFNLNTIVMNWIKQLQIELSFKFVLVREFVIWLKTTKLSTKILK